MIGETISHYRVIDKLGCTDLGRQAGHSALQHHSEPHQDVPEEEVKNNDHASIVRRSLAAWSDWKEFGWNQCNPLLRQDARVGDNLYDESRFAAAVEILADAY